MDYKGFYIEYYHPAFYFMWKGKTYYFETRLDAMSKIDELVKEYLR